MKDCEPKYVKGPRIRPFLQLVLHEAADETNDMADHDELHAAAAVVAMLTGAQYNEEYIYRWIDGLRRRIGDA